jgi:hypothetical protein
VVVVGAGGTLVRDRSELATDTLFTNSNFLFISPQICIIYIQGGLVFGYLQRAGSLYGTGLAAPRCLGATADTALRLNQLLSKQFCLAFADESYIKLTDLSSVEAIQQRLDGCSCDALILGTTMSVRQRAVVSGTYERTPNDKAYVVIFVSHQLPSMVRGAIIQSLMLLFSFYRWEVYWDEGSSATFSTSDGDAVEVAIQNHIMDSLLEAAKRCKTLRHLVVVDQDGSMVAKLQDTNIPFTCLICPSGLANVKDYTFQKGVQMDLSIRSLTDSSDDQTVQNRTPLYRQDIAALCVQILQTLSWETSRVLLVQSSAVSSSLLSVAQKVPWSKSGKRVDQEWCVNSHVLDEKLQPFLADDANPTVGPSY